MLAVLLHQEHLRTKSHQFEARVSVLNAMEKSRGEPGEKNLDSKLLDLQTDSPQSLLERTWSHQLLSILKDVIFRLFCELWFFIYNAKG